MTCRRVTFPGLTQADVIERSGVTLTPEQREKLQGIAVRGFRGIMCEEPELDEVNSNEMTLLEISLARNNNVFRVDENSLGWAPRQWLEELRNKMQWKK